MPFPPSAACRFFDLPPVNLQNLPLHLTKNSFASAPTHLCGIAYRKTFVPLRWQVAAALSAAVTITPKQENAPNSHGHTSWKEKTSLFPAALREGARGRGFSQRSRLPRITQSHLLFGRGGLGERRFSQRSGLSPRISYSYFLRKGARGRGFL